MKNATQNINTVTDNIFRKSQTKLVAVLVHYFGIKEIEFIEDIVQDTFLTATKQWRKDGLPVNPEAWLMDVAKKKTINSLKRGQLYQQKVLPTYASNELTTSIEWSDSQLTDGTLEMLFCICNASISVDAQITFALKTICGFKVSEIANSLLTSEQTINKRIYRTKKAFQQGLAELSLPKEEHVGEQSKRVFKLLYIMFNEGYFASHHKNKIRMDICYEAIRLLQIHLSKYNSSPEGNGLMALMLFNVARFESRLGDNAVLITMEDQDRSKWDKALIDQAVMYLNHATQTMNLNEYQLMAGINMEYMLADDFATTNWNRILKQYELLSNFRNDGIFELNKCVAQFYAGDAEQALNCAIELQDRNELSHYPMYQLTLAVMSVRLGKVKSATQLFKEAEKIATGDNELALIQHQKDKYIK